MHEVAVACRVLLRSIKFLVSAGPMELPTTSLCTLTMQPPTTASTSSLIGTRQ